MLFVGSGWIHRKEDVKTNRNPQPSCKQASYAARSESDLNVISWCVALTKRREKDSL